MTYVVAFIHDDTFEDPHVILGASERQVAHLVCRYLSIAQPHNTVGPMTVDPGRDYSLEQLADMLLDCEDVRLEWFSTNEESNGGLIMAAGSFNLWMSVNSDALSRQHVPHVVDVVDQL